jgi:hypothetical protein
MKTLITIISVIVLLFLTSCGGPPEGYLKAQKLYGEHKYDSAMFYFNSVLEEEGNWYDSSEVMKKEVVTAMVDNHLWDKYSKILSDYSFDMLLVNHAHNELQRELRQLVDLDSMTMVYEVIDNNDQIPAEVHQKVTEYYEEKILFGYEWIGKGSMRGQVLSFTREKINNYKGENQGNKIQAKSNKTKNGWSKGKVIYRNIHYDKDGIYHVQPRIFKSSYYGKTKQYFGKRGSLKFEDNNTFVINYGRAVSSNNRVRFIRGDKIESKKTVL